MTAGADVALADNATLATCGVGGGHDIDRNLAVARHVEEAGIVGQLRAVMREVCVVDVADRARHSTLGRRRQLGKRDREAGVWRLELAPTLQWTGADARDLGQVDRIILGRGLAAG